MRAGRSSSAGPSSPTPTTTATATRPRTPARPRPPCTSRPATRTSRSPWRGPAFGVVDRDTPYVVTVANHGPSAAAGVTVTDVIPSGARFVRTEGAATCTPGATVRCTLPDDRARRERHAHHRAGGQRRGRELPPRRERHDDEHRPDAGRPQRVGRHARHRARASRRRRSRSRARRARTRASAGATTTCCSAAASATACSAARAATCCAGAPATTACSAARAPTCSTATAATTACRAATGATGSSAAAATIACSAGAKGDELHGDTGNDQLFPGTGRDRVWGGAGNDAISARDGSRDVIDCGAGLDRVTADRRDSLRGCERVSRR